MLRRKTQPEGLESFEDRSGDSEAKKRKFGGKKFNITDEVEEKLETLVFGKLPFQAVEEGAKDISEVRTLFYYKEPLNASSPTGMMGQDEEETRGDVTGPQPKHPAWQDEDDTQLRFAIV